MPPKRQRKARKDVRKGPRKDVRKDTSIQIRATVEQKKSLDEFASKRGLSLSGWMLTTCLEVVAATAAKAAEADK